MRGDTSSIADSETVTLTISVPGFDLRQEIMRALVADEERVAREAVIEYLRAHGYIVERPADGAQLSGHAIAVFRAAWHAADAEGRVSGRVRAGLEAARKYLNLDAVAKIDELRPAPNVYTGSLEITAVRATLDEIRQMIAPGIPTMLAEHSARAGNSRSEAGKPAGS